MMAGRRRLTEMEKAYLEKCHADKPIEKFYEEMPDVAKKVIKDYVDVLMIENTKIKDVVVDIPENTANGRMDNLIDRPRPGMVIMTQRATEYLDEQRKNLSTKPMDCSTFCVHIRRDKPFVDSVVIG